MERDKIPYLYGKLNQEIQRGIVEEITITPKAEGVVEEPKEGYDGFSKVTIPAEVNLIPENIRKNTSIYGVTGTIEALYKDENLTPENLRDGVTVYADTIAETTGTMKAQTIDTKALIEGVGDYHIDDSTLTKVRDYAFYEASNLTSFKGNNVSQLGNSSFLGCYNLGQVEFSDSLVQIPDLCFFVQSNQNQQPLEINFENITTVGRQAFAQRTLDASTIITCTNIAQQAFNNTNQYGSQIQFKPQQQTTQIGQDAFARCKLSLVEGTLSGLQSGSFSYVSQQSTNKCLFKIKIIGDVSGWCFAYNNYASIELDATSEISSLGDSCFYQFGLNRDNASENRLKFDFRNSTVDIIPQRCFYQVTYSDIYLPKRNSIIQLSNSNAFSNTTDTYIYVPESQEDEYLSATNWSAITSKIRTW